MTVLMNPIPEHLAYVLMNPGVNAHFDFRPFRVLQNPAALKAGKRSPFTVAFVMGLTMTRFPKKNGRFKKTTPQAVRKFLMKYFSGGTIILQLGWWSRAPEDSVKVILENRGMVSSQKFKKMADGVIKEALTKFGQYEIYVDYFRGTRRVGKPTVAYWKS